MNDRPSSTPEASENTAKMAFEWLKQLTTLSFTAIVIIATFLENLYSDPWWPALIPWTLGLLLGAALGSVATMLALIFGRTVPTVSPPITLADTLIDGAFIYGFILTTASFFGGVSCFAAFAIRNAF